MSECKRVKLGDIASVQTGPFGSQLHQEDYVMSGTPIITVEHLGDNRILHEDTPYVSDEDKVRLLKYSLLEGDIVFSRVGSVDRCAYVRKEEEGWLFSGRCLRIRVDTHIVNPRYLSFYFGHPAFKTFIRQIAVGATMPSLNTKIMNDIAVPLPSLFVQEKIAAILSSLYDKIELNTRINKVLEEIAQTLFKRWFVDFEFPDVNGKPYKSSGGRMVDSEMGMIPEGWEVKSVSEILTINPKLSLAKGTVRTYVDMASLETNTCSISETSIKEYAGGSKFQNGDVLLARITPCLENGKTAIVDVLSDEEVGFGSTEFIVLRGNEVISTSYIYCLSRYSEFRNHCIASMVGSSGRQRVQNSCFDDFFVAKPHDELYIKFEDVCGKLFRKITENNRSNKELREIRDNLLPKLMRGDIDGLSNI